MLKESKGKYVYRCVFCDAIKASDNPRAVIYCTHDNGLNVLMVRRPIKLKQPERNSYND
jgi:hypothetical protein